MANRTEKTSGVSTGEKDKDNAETVRSAERLMKVKNERDSYKVL